MGRDVRFGLQLSSSLEADPVESEIADQLRACRDRWGISYFVVRELEAFAPIIQRCR